MTAPEPTLAAGEIERLCEVMHNTYEAAALEAGWETQAVSAVDWRDVPEANKVTMRVAVRALLAARTEPDEGAVEVLADLVRLKDGPRDDAYRAEKEAAWERARAALRAAGVVTGG